MKIRATTISKLLLLMVLSVSLSRPELAHAQVRAGSAYLKLTPGTRQQSLANSLTGALDDSYLLYANPGAVGFMREWQWSASYTEWIADIFNLSLLYGRHLRLKTPWSNRVMVALGVNYQGVRDFDATRGAQPSANASDLLLNASIGIPLGMVNRNLSFGINVKYLRSELAQHSASSLVFDVGAIYRSRRFHISDRGFFRQGIVSAGISLNQLGKSLEFINTRTPLPRTFRAGLAVNLGRHDGLQLQLSADYQNLRDEDGRFGVGVQLTNLFSRLIAVRAGFNQIDNRNTDLLSKYAVGLSMKLDDYMNTEARATRASSLLKIARNSDLRVDTGFLDGQKVGKVYQGSVTGRVNRPEHFEFISPFSQQFTRLDTIALAWQATRDPDLYDDVNYMLFLAREDSVGLSQLIAASETYAFDPAVLVNNSHPGVSDGWRRVDFLNLAFYPAALDTTIRLVAMDELRGIFTIEERSTLVSGKNTTVAFAIPPGLEHGQYFWTVMAYDRNHHARFIEQHGRQVAAFHVITPPDLTIRIKKEIQEPVTLKSQRIYFDFASDRLDETSRAKLDDWVRFLKAYPDTFIVTGHADIQADPRLTEERRREVNLEWSERRARSVFNYLVAQGIDSTRLKLRWFGEAAPVDTNLTRQAFSRNRRVELQPPPGFALPAPRVVANVVVTNHFEQAKNFSVTVSAADEAERLPQDELLTSKVPIFIPSDADSSQNLFDEKKKIWLQELQPGQSDSIQVPWENLRATLLAQVDVEDNVAETPEGEFNNWDLGRISYDLQIRDAVDQYIVQSGDTVQYQITVTNLGSDLATDLRVVHRVPETMRVIYVEQPRINDSCDTLLWHIPFLRPNESHTLMFEAVIQELDFDSTAFVITNHSSVLAHNDVNPANNDATTTIYAALIKFEFNKCELTADSKQVLRDLADILANGSAGQRYLISGFADTTGSSRVSVASRKAYNKELSCLRAKAARKFLLDAGVTAELIAVGRGESSRYDTYEKNRRVEIRAIPKTAVVEDCVCSRSLRHCPCEN